MKYKFLIFYDGVTGTNDEATATYWSKCDDAYVVNCETGVILQTYPEVAEVEIKEETHNQATDDALRAEE